MEAADSMLKAVPIGLLIRSIFSGGFFVIAFYLATTANPDWSKIDAKTILDVGLPVSLFSGMLIYGIQRAWVYPLFEWFFESKAGDRAVKWTISERVIDTAIWRWNLNREKPTDNKLLNEQLNKWADIIHTQYSVVLCIIFGSVAGLAVDPQATHGVSKPLIYTALLFLGSGLFNNARHYAFIQGIKKRGFFAENLKGEDGGEKPKT